MMEEMLYEVNNAYYLHIQISDEGVGYTIYRKDTWELMDGGVLSVNAAGVGIATLVEILGRHDILLGTAKVRSLELLEQLYSQEVKNGN